MAHNPLIPTPRVDKNGRTIIRHMKAEGHSSPLTAVPVPKLAASSMEGFDRKHAISGIVFILEEYGGVENKNELKQALKSFGDEDIARVKEVCWTLNDLLVNSRGMRIGRNCEQVVQAIHKGDTESISVYHRYRDQVRSNYAFEHVDATRKVLEEKGVYEPYSGYEPASFDAHMKMVLSYSPLEEEMLDEDEALGFQEMRVAQNYSRVDHLVDYVEQHPERVDDILLFRTEREELGFSDMVEFFNAMEESNAPAVSQGWL